MTKELKEAIKNNEEAFEKNQEVMEKALDTNKEFNMDLAESMRNTQSTCDYIQKCNEPKTMEDVAINMERIKNKMEWNKMCAIEHKVDLLNDKMDLILKKLGDM